MSYISQARPASPGLIPSTVFSTIVMADFGLNGLELKKETVLI